MANLTVDAKPKGIGSAYVSAHFDEGLEALAGAGYRIISLQENARLRMQEGAYATVSKRGNWTRDGILYLPTKGTFLTKNSPIIANAKEATNCHREGKEFYLTEEQVEQATQDSVKLTDIPIPTNRFGEYRMTHYAFGEDAQKYGEFLREAGIIELRVRLTGIQDKPFVRQVWLCGLERDYRCDLHCGYWSLNDSNTVRGVRIFA